MKAFIPSDIGAGRAPKPPDDIYVKIPLGLPLPHVGDSIVIDAIPYTVKSRALMIANDAYHGAFWNLLVEKSGASPGRPLLQLLDFNENISWRHGSFVFIVGNFVSAGTNTIR